MGSLLLVTILAIAALAAGCNAGADADDTLHLGGALEFTEAEFRTFIATELMRDENAEAFCLSIADFADKEIVEFFFDGPIPDRPAPATVPNEQDLMRAAGILKEECDRIY